jgi:heme-binding protein
MVKKILKYGALALVLGVLIAQFIKVERTNPPLDPAASFEAVAKPTPEAAAVVGRACRDCHSNQTVWPWYSQIAPVSWLIASDVKEGRAKLNFSQWNIYSPEMTRIKLGQICEEVKKAEMPPAYYVPMHPEAKLTAADVSAVCAVPMAALR